MLIYNMYEEKNYSHFLMKERFGKINLYFGKIGFVFRYHCS